MAKGFVDDTQSRNPNEETRTKYSVALRINWIGCITGSSGHFYVSLFHLKLFSNQISETDFYRQSNIVNIIELPSNATKTTSSAPKPVTCISCGVRPAKASFLCCYSSPVLCLDCERNVQTCPNCRIDYTQSNGV
ncbi:uncharacterized protein LOC120333458 [Styela clava]